MMQKLWFFSQFSYFNFVYTKNISFWIFLKAAKNIIKFLIIFDKKKLHIIFLKSSNKSKEIKKYLMWLAGNNPENIFKEEFIIAAIIWIEVILKQ